MPHIRYQDEDDSSTSGSIAAVVLGAVAGFAVGMYVAQRVGGFSGLADRLRGRSADTDESATPAVADDFADFDEDLDDEIEDEDEDSPRSNGRTRTLSRPKKAAGGKTPSKVRGADRPGIFARIVNFVREVVAELRKVIWPTRKELLTYTAVVIVFVTIMFSIVALLDLGFAKAMFAIFGGAPTKSSGNP